MEKITPGIYRHYKGQEYQVLGIARHSETQESFVVYKALYQAEEANMWIRPLAMFSETVVVDGTALARFQRTGN
jgi:hypothetical protein